MVDAEKRLTQILTEIGNVAPTILNERQQRLISGSIKPLLESCLR